MNFLSRLRPPGSSPGRAESQLASELGELTLLDPQRAAVQQLSKRPDGPTRDREAMRHRSMRMVAITMYGSIIDVAKLFDYRYSALACAILV